MSIAIENETVFIEAGATLHPTGTCFEDVTMFFAKLCHENEHRLADPKFRMVHGICLMENDRPYAHAWIEEGKNVWFSSILKDQKVFVQCPRKDFYKRFRVKDFTRYTFLELLELSKKVGNAPPPWEEKYLVLCRDYNGGRKI